MVYIVFSIYGYLLNTYLEKESVGSASANRYDKGILAGVSF